MAPKGDCWGGVEDGVWQAIPIGDPIGLDPFQLHPEIVIALNENNSHPMFQMLLLHGWYSSKHWDHDWNLSFPPAQIDTVVRDECN